MLRFSTEPHFHLEPMSPRIANHRVRINSRSALDNGPRSSLQATSLTEISMLEVRSPKQSGSTNPRRHRERTRSNGSSFRKSGDRVSPTMALEQMSFFEAVCEGDVESVLEHLNNKVQVDVVDANGNTALLLAAEGEPEIVDALLQAGCNVDHQNSAGTTAIMVATKCARQLPANSHAHVDAGPCSLAHICAVATAFHRRR